MNGLEEKGLVNYVFFTAYRRHGLLHKRKVEER